MTATTDLRATAPPTPADLAIAVNGNPQAFRDSHIAGLRGLGLNGHDILEGISIAAFIGATNRIGIALSVPPNPEHRHSGRTGAAQRIEFGAMKTRHFVAAAVLGSATVLAGCSTPEPALGGTTAKVIIDGKNSGALAVHCRQTGWAWYIETPQKDSGFTAVLQMGGEVSPKSVDFRGIGGFTGTYWADNIGEAKVTGVNGKYTISGSANGNFADNPTKAATADFRIETNC
jgi:hypothetical protein